MTHITLPRETVQQAIDALAASVDVPCYGGHPRQEAALQALRTALEAAPAAMGLPFVPWSKEAEMRESWQAAPAAQESVGWVMDGVGTVAWHKDVPPEGTDLFIGTQRDGVCS